MNRYIYYWLCVFVAPFGFKWMIKKCPYGYVDACPNWNCQDIIEDESIIGNVLDKIEITIQNESSKVYMKKKALTFCFTAF